MSGLILDLIYTGTSTFIYWESLIKGIDKVDIYYSLDNGESWLLISKNVDNNGKYNWPISKNLESSRKCLIKIVSSKNNNQLDRSDNIFRIK